VARPLQKNGGSRKRQSAARRQALLAVMGTDVEIWTNETAESREFNEILKKDGAKAAIAWRAGRSA
jgi:hypothetical protein